MPGIIALDIDGTLTAEPHHTPEEVATFLETLKDWQLLFVTGRPFRWGVEALETFNFPFHFAAYNGAILLEMPSRKIVSRKYLTKAQLEEMETIGKNFVIYGGYESGDTCYYRPQFFSKEHLAYLEGRRAALDERWIAVESFVDLPIDSFAAFKFFSKETTLSSWIEKRLGLHAPAIRDPYDSSYFVIQATHPYVSKGECLEEFKTFTGKTFTIAAGDDQNDRSMLQRASIAIVMATAPEEMRALADIIAPPATECGIIQGLKEAILAYRV